MIIRSRFSISILSTTRADYQAVRETQLWDTLAAPLELSIVLQTSPQEETITQSFTEAAFNNLKAFSSRVRLNITTRFSFNQSLMGTMINQIWAIITVKSIMWLLLLLTILSARYISLNNNSKTVSFSTISTYKIRKIRIFFTHSRFPSINTTLFINILNLLTSNRTKDLILRCSTKMCTDQRLLPTHLRIIWT